MCISISLVQMFTWATSLGRQYYLGWIPAGQHSMTEHSGNWNFRWYKVLVSIHLCCNLFPSPLIYLWNEIGMRGFVVRLFCLECIVKYRVFHNNRHKIMAYCSKIKSPSDFLRLLGAYQMWSIW